MIPTTHAVVLLDDDGDGNTCLSPVVLLDDDDSCPSDGAGHKELTGNRVVWPAEPLDAEQHIELEESPAREMEFPAMEMEHLTLADNEDGHGGMEGHAGDRDGCDAGEYVRDHSP